MSLDTASQRLAFRGEAWAPVNVRGEGTEGRGSAAPNYGNYVTFLGKILMIRATTEKTLQNNTVGAVFKSRK